MFLCMYICVRYNFKYIIWCVFVCIEAKKYQHKNKFKYLKRKVSLKVFGIVFSKSMYVCMSAYTHVCMYVCVCISNSIILF